MSICLFLLPGHVCATKKSNKFSQQLHHIIPQTKSSKNTRFLVCIANYSVSISEIYAKEQLEKCTQTPCANLFILPGHVSATKKSNKLSQQLHHITPQTKISKNTRFLVCITNYSVSTSRRCRPPAVASTLYVGCNSVIYAPIAGLQSGDPQSVISVSQVSV